MPILSFGRNTPRVDPKAYVSAQSTIVGDVEVGSGANVWPGAVIRGDLAPVTIGENTCVQDSALVHAHSEQNPAIIGNNVIIGTAAVLYGVYIGDSVHIGDGCVVFDGATIGEGVVLKPGSIVPANVVIPPRSLSSGVPAAQIREVSRDEVEEHLIRAEAIAQVFQKLKHWQQSA